MVAAGQIGGSSGALGSGLYSPENVAAVYEEVLRRANDFLTGGTSVVLDGTWRDARQRDSARRLGDRTNSPMVELACSLPLVDASARIRARHDSNSDATPQVAAALAREIEDTGHRIDTSRPLVDSVAEAQQICCLAV
jgi:predicted kinase